MFSLLGSLGGFFFTTTMLITIFSYMFIIYIIGAMLAMLHAIYMGNSYGVAIVCGVFSWVYLLYYWL